jgi:hypothetical protein
VGGDLETEGRKAEGRESQADGRETGQGNKKLKCLNSSADKENIYLC